MLLSLINTHINIISQKFSSTPFHLLFIILYSSSPCGSTPVLPGYLLLQHSCTWDKTTIFWSCQILSAKEVLPFPPLHESWWEISMPSCHLQIGQEETMLGIVIKITLVTTSICCSSSGPLYKNEIYMAQCLARVPYNPKEAWLDVWQSSPLW